MSESNGPQRRNFRNPFQPSAVILICAQVIMGVTQVVIGALYQYECPRQPYIPIYLLVTGVGALLLTVLSILPCCPCFANQSNVWSCFVSLFFLCWFITGNVWIYSIYEPNYNKTVSSLDTYCNKTLYLFAFWTVNLFYILLGLAIFCNCCLCLLGGS